MADKSKSNKAPDKGRAAMQAARTEANKQRRMKKNAAREAADKTKKPRTPKGTARFLRRCKEGVCKVAAPKAMLKATEKRQ
jgi:uncharacterized protein (DUF2147 family)